MIESLTIAASGAAVVIGGVLPWAYARSMLVIPGHSRDQLYAVSGTGFDGETTIALGAVAIIVAWVLTIRPSPALRLGAVVPFVWAAWIAVATIDLLSPTPSRMLPDDFLIAPGYGFGLIVTFVGAIGGSLVSLVWLIRSLRTVHGAALLSPHERSDVGTRTP